MYGNDGPAPVSILTRVSSGAFARLTARLTAIRRSPNISALTGVTRVTTATKARSFTSVSSGTRRRFDRARPIVREGPVMPALFFALGGTGRADALPDALRPVAQGSRRLPCPWNRPRADFPADAQATWNRPRADALRPVAQGSRRLPCPWNRPRADRPADAQATWNRPRADALRPVARGVALPCPWNRPRADLSGRCPGNVEPAAGRCPARCPGSRACPARWTAAAGCPGDVRPMPWPVEPAAGRSSAAMPRATWNRPRRRMPCPMPSGRCPGYVITRKLLSIILPSDNRREILPSFFDYSTI